MGGSVRENATGGLRVLTARGETAEPEARVARGPGVLLEEAAARAREETGASLALACLACPGETALTRSTGASNETAPGREALEALAAHGEPAALLEAGLPSALTDYARKFGFETAAPLVLPDALGAIFVRGSLRPRERAALGQVAARLERPLAAALAGERLASVDAELTRMTRLAQLGDLLAESVHEIRNPLVSVKTFLELLPENLDDPDFLTNFREQVIDEVRRMERLLDGVLEQSRPRAGVEGAPASAEPGVVLASVARLLEKRAQEKQLKLVVDIGADLGHAAIDEDALRQVVLNLTLNAFHVSPDGGCVRLQVRVADAGDALQVLVDDEGPGVPEPERERLFEAFYSTRAERPVGLGLAVCRRLVAAAGGSVDVEDAPGEAGGARFRIELPCASAPESPDAE